MGNRPRRIESTLSRRDFLGACGCASTLLLPAPLFGAMASPVAQEVAHRLPVVSPPFSDYRILPNYRTHSPLEELIRKARQKVDDYPSERYGREIESHFSGWAVELRKN